MLFSICFLIFLLFPHHIIIRQPNNKTKDARRTFFCRALDKMSENIEWVQCILCSKWRVVLGSSSASLKDPWFCIDNSWDAFNKCIIPEEDVQAAALRVFRLDSAPGARIPQSTKKKKKRKAYALARLDSHCKPGACDYAPCGKTEEYIRDELQPRESLYATPPAKKSRTYTRHGNSAKSHLTIRPGDRISCNGKIITVKDIEENNVKATFKWPTDGKEYRAHILRRYLDNTKRIRLDVQWDNDKSLTDGIKPWIIAPFKWSGTLDIIDDAGKKFSISISKKLALCKEGSDTFGDAVEAWKYSL